MLWQRRRQRLRKLLRKIPVYTIKGTHTFARAFLGPTADSNRLRCLWLTMSHIRSTCICFYFSHFSLLFLYRHRRSVLPPLSLFIPLFVAPWLLPTTSMNYTIFCVLVLLLFCFVLLYATHMQRLTTYTLRYGTVFAVAPCALGVVKQFSVRRYTMRLCKVDH